MTPETLLNRLAIEGLRLTPNGEQIEVTGDLQRLTPELRELIRSHRQGLLCLLELSEERLAIQQEHLASPGDLDWPSFQDIADRKLPPGWAITQWIPAEFAPSQRQYAESLEAAGAKVYRVAGDCRCGSSEGILVPIHDGGSLRKDCALCGRFLDFVAWHDAERVLSLLASVEHNEQDAPEVAPSRGVSDDNL